jgi:cell division protein FtsI (penicillin-binding protein 3)
MTNTGRRFKAFVAFTALFLLLILGQYFQVMVLEEDAPAAPRETRNGTVERGPILDRNGKVLAIQTRLYSVTAWMPSVSDAEDTANILAPALDMNVRDLLSQMRAEDGFMYIQRKVSPSVSNTVRNLIEEHSLTGISLEAEYGRNYPEKRLAAHVLGFVGTDNVGLSGLELTYEETLSPSPGEGKNYGNQLFLTLDTNVQYMSEEIAREAMEQHEADSVMVMVMDARNGDILGWASLPSFDPNRFTAATDKQKRNLPLTFAYEPGSVFKIFSIASMIDRRAITPRQSFVCKGYYEHEFPGDETVRIQCLGTHGEVDAQEILQYSCNAGAAYASDEIGEESFYRAITDFGFGSPVHLPLPGETAGLLKPPRRWSGRTKPTIAIGQEISVSALQMITAATALTNEGTLLQPHIVKKIVSPAGKLVEENTREPVKEVLSPETAEAVLLMMETATSEQGTARRARLEHVRTSAKTGTAQKFDPETGTYSDEAYIASCMGIFPTDDPQLITYVVINRPRGKEYYGGRIAAPLVKRLGDRLVSYLNLAAESEKTVRHSGVIRIPELPPVEVGKQLPDFRGIAKRRLLPLLGREDLKVYFEGEGWVASQSPPPGTPVKEDMEIRLRFE